MQICRHADIHTYIHACIHTPLHTYIHTYTLTYIHTYIHSYIHTYIDGLKGEHYKYASDRLYILLTLCFNAMLIHGYMCKYMMKTILVPIVKDKNEDL